MREIKLILQICRAIFVLPFIDWTDEKMVDDVKRWKKIYHLEKYNNWVAVAILLNDYKEFRNLFIYRNRYRHFFRIWIKAIYRPMETLYIQAKEIGGGLFIQHGFATMISAEYIGNNCWINQQVTIGFNGNGKAPVIGDNVMITCGAKVLGEITVGSNSVIGANAVVIRDVESSCIMGGVPARKLK